MKEDHPLNPTTTYGASKASQDILIQSYDKMYDLNYFIFRPFNNFGERQNDQTYAALIPITIKRIMNGLKPIQHGDGKQTRDYIYVKDTVDAVVRLAKTEKSRKQIINVSRGKEIAVEFIIKTICKKMNYKGEIEVIPNPRLVDVKRHWSSNEKLKSILAINPTPFEVSIGNVIDYYLEKAKSGEVE
jgi:UDP-glucose 4-epimerase